MASHFTDQFLLSKNSALNLFFPFVNIPVHLSFMLLIHKYSSLRGETTENQ